MIKIFWWLLMATSGLAGGSLLENFPHDVLLVAVAFINCFALIKINEPTNKQLHNENTNGR